MVSRNNQLALTSISILFFVGLSFAVIIHETVCYERPVRSIRGRVTGYGQVVPVFWVDVYDNAQVCLDDKMLEVEKRKRQIKVASVEPDGNGEFNVTHLRKGFYEVEFGNHGRGGYNILSVLVRVDPKGTEDRLCVKLSPEGGGGQSSVARCTEVTVVTPPL
jgi:hypothetical protein